MTALGALLSIVAGLLAIPGWLVNMPSTEARYQCRMYAWIALTGCFGCWTSHDFADRKWWLFAIGLLAVFGGMSSVGTYWHKIEQIRAFKRALKQKPMWLP